jgi:hypothetical protein
MSLHEQAHMHIDADNEPSVPVDREYETSIFRSRPDLAGRHAHPAGADGAGGGGPDDRDGQRHRAARCAGRDQQRDHGGGPAGAGHGAGLHALEGQADRGTNARIDTALVLC